MVYRRLTPPAVEIARHKFDGGCMKRTVVVFGQPVLCSAPRHKELVERSSLIGAALIDLAVTHICQDKDERRADDYGHELRNGQMPDCSKTP